MTHTEFIASLAPETRAALARTEDRAGLRQLAAHWALIALPAFWIAAGLPFWGVMLFPLGIALAFLFTLQHECTHRTPFRTPWLNEGIGHLCGAILIQPFLWFRTFHMAHHRHTNDPGKDPELAQPKPETAAEIVRHIFAPRYWRDKFVVLLENAGGGSDADYIPERLRPQLRAEALALVALYAFALAFTLFVSTILVWIWLLPLAFGFPVLRLYLLAEHGRCPAVADMFDNTRTTLTNRLVRLVAWNMPYHAEHHAMPTVPFHRLPEVHSLARAHLKRVSGGYVGYVRDTLAAAP